VILDMQMPGMDGLMVARAIRAVPELHAVRLIMLTSSGTGDAQSVREAGIAVSMTKPVRKAQLYDCLTNVMGASTAPTAQTSECRMVHSGTTSSGARILLAEDNPVNQEVALGMLDALGHLVDVVGTGREAVNASAGTDYDLIFMDCQMPEMDGLSATRAIRAREAQALGTGGKRDSRGTRADDPCHIPIIALTAHAMASDRELCLAAGMDDYLSKPFTQDQLSTMLTRWLPGLERRQPPISPSHPEHLSHPPDPAPAGTSAHPTTRSSPGSPSHPERSLPPTSPQAGQDQLFSRGTRTLLSHPPQAIVPPSQPRIGPDQFSAP
jgi:two-component system, sensor histidine kinase and response regulator